MSNIVPITAPATATPGVHGIAPGAILLVSALSLGCWVGLAHALGLI